MIDAQSFVPSRAFLTKGVGRHKEKLTSFELALREASIAPYNLVRVSSIFPPHCELLKREEGSRLLRPGQVVFAVIAEASSNESSRLCTAAIGLALPGENGHHGYISEHHTYGQHQKSAGDYAEELAASMLATVLGIPFDPETDWDELKQHFLLDGRIVKSQSMVATAECQDDGRWVTAVAAMVFCG